MAHNLIMIIIIIYIYKCIQDIYCVDFVSIVYQQFGGAFAFVYPINEIKVKHAIACALNAVCVCMLLTKCFFIYPCGGIFVCSVPRIRALNERKADVMEDLWSPLFFAVYTRKIVFSLFSFIFTDIILISCACACSFATFIGAPYFYICSTIHFGTHIVKCTSVI